MRGNNKKIGIYVSLYALFILILFYAIQDFQTSANTGVREAERGAVHVALLIILVFLGGFFAKTMSRGGNIPSPVTKMLWLITFWIVAVNLIQSVNGWSVAVHLGLSVLWILVYYFFGYYVRRFPKAWPHVEFCIVIMFGFYVFSALYGYYILPVIYNRIVPINLAYSVLVFLPWLALMSTKRISWLGNILVFLVVLVSMKRGAIIAYPMMLSTLVLSKALLEKRMGRAAFKVVIMVAVFYGGLVLVDQWTGGFLSERFSAESISTGSGRVQNYTTVLSNIEDRSPQDLLIGLGSGSSVQLLGTGVHNEWLEFLYSFGVVGVMLYLFLFIALTRTVHKLIRRSSPYAPAYAMAVVYMLVVGMVGGIYFVHSTLYIMAFFGVVEGLMIRDARNPKHHCNFVATSDNREVLAQ